MMKQQSNKEWLHDVEMRQRNIVFPDTMKNEARFWRNLMDSKGRLSATQIIGISLMYLALIVGWVVLAIIQFRATADSDSGWKTHILHAYGVSLISAFFIGCGFLLLR
jgi:hypothetical protein